MRSSYIFALMGAVGLCLSAGMASANTSALTFSQSSTTPYVWTANVFGGAPTTTGSFSDIFTFTDPVMPSTAPAGGSVNGLSLGINGTNVIFTLFQLVDTTTSAVLGTGVTGGTQSFLSFLLPNGTDNYALNVSGNVTPAGTTGAYAGSVVVSEVPEPKTYAMLLAGVGLLAFAARRRRTNFF